jgi:anaphase-promoting complex subunit 6
LCHPLLPLTPLPFPQVLPVHICALVELDRRSDLFYCAHQLVAAYPALALPWFAVGCYYLLVGKHDLARRYFHKCTAIDPRLAGGWIGYGHAFALQEESDQAMAAYRTAARLFEGSHVPLLCLAMEHLRNNNTPLAEQFLHRARLSCPTDPLVFNELGVIAYRERRWAEGRGSGVEGV